MVRSRSLIAAVLLALSPVAAGPVAPAAVELSQDAGARVQAALRAAKRHLSAGRMGQARDSILQALERDRASRPAWQMLARWAEAAAQPGERLRALHEDLRLAGLQGAKKAELKALRDALGAEDERSGALFAIADEFQGKLATLARRYEKEGRWHGALRVWKQALALAPRDEEALAGIDRVTSQPDPSLAGDARSKDLLDGVSAEWIAEHDEETKDWKEGYAELEREHYITRTNAGYEVLVRSAEAMEQVNAFYREFFRYGGAGDGRTVPRIIVHIFATRQEYLDLGFSPAEWSGGHFTGSHVETYVPEGGGYESMVGTLFHEAAHQFVSIATSATGWLNEGLASFFEGTRILANGSVVMNLPADHRLFPLAERIERGWLEAEEASEITSETPGPFGAPTFRIVLENRYTWGPAWYAPTWGVVFFLYNFQDPWDGRFVYRKAFQEFIDKSGGRMGEGAVRNFEEVVLANPEPPLDSKPPKGTKRLKLPETVDDLNQVWADWILALRDAQAVSSEDQTPWLRWARFARDGGRPEWAIEHFEKGLLDDPSGTELMLEFAEVLAEKEDGRDRATALLNRAIGVFERADPPDALAIAGAERQLRKLDPMATNLTGLVDEVAAQALALVEGYRDAGQDEMVLDLAWRFGSSFGSPALMREYGDAVRRRGKGLERWELAYNEENLDGWSPGSTIFAADSTVLRASFGEVQPGNFDYSFLTLDRVTSGDFTMEAELQIGKGRSSYAGFVFGQKGDTNFHGALVFPARGGEGLSDSGFVDLMTSRGGSNQAWRHVPVRVAPEEGRSGGNWHRLRLDVVGRLVDVWFDDELVATHEFPSISSVRGRFGLASGRGKADFRRVRFQLRDPRDPAAAIEREVRIESAAKASGGAIAGSYQGQIPPFPRVERWVQEERLSWSDRGPVPQLVVYMSRHQNKVVPIDGWLRSLAERGREYGLEILTVMAADDSGGAEDFLSDHPLPGAVGVDERPPGGDLGESFEKAFIDRFNLPRLWLLDLDGSVVWEGDPGFPAGSPPSPPYHSFVDDPLKALVDSRRVPERVRWRRDWERIGKQALAEGDLERVLPLLVTARSFEPALEPNVARAARIHKRLEEAFGALDDWIPILEDQSAEAAAGALGDWAPLFGASKRDVSRALRAPLKSSGAKDWNLFLKAAQRFPPKRKEPGPELDLLLGRLAEMQSPWAARIAAELQEAKAAEDWDAAKEILSGAERAPGVWLVNDLLGL